MKTLEIRRAKRIIRLIAGVIGAMGLVIAALAFGMMFYLGSKGELLPGEAVMFLIAGLVGSVMTFVGITLGD